MSRVVGIICEYNPFHKGHKYQIEQIRAEIPDATIIAIMSGNIVQRGEFAIISKYDRAKIALELGVNAVFELPYPYSGSTAEIFAHAGVEIASKLCCDYLYFGTESKSLSELEKISDLVDSREFESVMKEFMADKALSYISCKSMALKSLGVEGVDSANDMLAIEYIRAIKKKNLPIEYRAIARIGASYNSLESCDVMSATAIRSHYYTNGSFVSVPASEAYGRIAKEKRTLDYKTFSRLLHTFVLLNSDKIDKAFDTPPEMAALIKTEAKKCSDSGAFLDTLSSKKFTSARMKRAILYALFDVSCVDFSPEFTILLGMDKKGQSFVNKIKKEKQIEIITKHADGKRLGEKAIELLEKLYLADGVYNTLLLNQRSPSEAYKNKPIIKN